MLNILPKWVESFLDNEFKELFKQYNQLVELQIHYDDDTLTLTYIVLN